MGLVEEGGKVGTAAVGAMSSQPLAIALLVVNIGFLAFAGYVLGEVAENAQQRNKNADGLAWAVLVDDDLATCRGLATPGKSELDLRLPGEPAMTQITKNFTLRELTHSQTAARKGVRNIPHGHSHEYKNLQRTAEVMELVRTILGGKPILISSGYAAGRSTRRSAGGRADAHIQGLAVDFTCPGFKAPLDICG